MNEHVSREDLAEHDAGLLDASREQRVAEHLAGCADCSARLVAVQRVSLVLAAQPSPAMPADVFARLHATVTDLAAAGSSPVEPSAAGVDTGSTDPDHSSRTGSGRPSSVELEPAAGAAAEPFAAAKHPTGAYPAAGVAGAQGGWARPTMGTLETTLARRRRRPAKILAGALATCGLATAVGFGGYVLSGLSGHNEPAADAPMVVQSQGQTLGSVSELENRSGLGPHRFSEAWNCARQVTSGRITGIRASVLNGRSGFLVFLAGADDSTRVVFVSGCGTAQPSAGPSTVLPKS